MRYLHMTLLALLLLDVTSSAAAPPVLTNSTVRMGDFNEETHVQAVNVSIRVSDPDGDLDPATVKLVATFADGTKEKLVLTGSAGGLFAGQFLIDTSDPSRTREIHFKYKAKDRAREKAERVEFTLGFFPEDTAPIDLVAEQTDFSAGFGQIIPLSATVIGRDGHGGNVTGGRPLIFDVVSGDGIFVSEDGQTPLGESTEVTPNGDGTAVAHFQVGRSGRHTVTAHVAGLPSGVYSVVATTPSAPLGITVEGDGSFVVYDSRVKGIVRIDPITGARRVVSSARASVGTGPEFVHVENLGVDGNGDIFALDAGLIAVVRVDPSTGDRTILSGCADESCDSQIGTGPPLERGYNPRAMVLEASGTLVVIESRTGLLRVDPSTGDRTLLSGCLDPECNIVVGSGPPLDHSRAITIDDDGSFVVAGYRNFVGTVLRVDSLTGDRTVLSGCSEFNERDECVSRIGSGQDLEFPHGLVVGADGAPIVVDRHFERALSRIDPETGDRTIISGCVGSDLVPAFVDECVEVIGGGLPFQSPTGISIEADGTLVVADEGFEHVVRVDPVTGNRTPVVPHVSAGGGPGLFSPRALSIEPGGNLVVTDTLFGLLRVDPGTGMRTILSGCPEPVMPGECDGASIGNGLLFRNPSAIAVDSSGTLFVSDGDSGTVFRVGATTGNRTVITGCAEDVFPEACETVLGDGPSLYSIFALVVEEDGSLVVGDSTRNALVRVDAVSGDRTLLSGCPEPRELGPCTNPIGGGRPFGGIRTIAVEEDGMLLVGDSSLGGVIRVDPTTRERTVISGCVTARARIGCLDQLVGKGPELGSIADISIDTDTILALDLKAIVRIDPVTGDRTLVSGCRERDSQSPFNCVDMVGAGPELFKSSSLTIEPDGSILVLDEKEIVRVDPVTGNRTIFSR